MAVKFTKLKLKHEWLGNPKGAVMEINSAMAHKLFLRKVAVPVEKDKPKAKDVALPPKDKMMKPVRQKRVLNKP